MTPLEYQQQCQVTESMPSDQMHERADSLEFGIGTLYQRTVEVGADVDTMKRFIFYDKTPTEYSQKICLRSYQLNTEKYNCDQSGPFRQTRADYMLRLLHGFIGVITEIGELGEGLQNLPKVSQDDLAYAPDQVPVSAKALQNVKEELGDLMWYISLICNAVGLSLEEVIEGNIRKLRARYGSKFSEFDAVNRNTSAEMVALDNTPRRSGVFVNDCDKLPAQTLQEHKHPGT